MKTSTNAAMTDSINKYSDSIRKTGFILENRIVNILQRNGWTTISNRYYEDDLENSIREMDILAYKSTIKTDFVVYTTLLISCKKNEENAWALLTRKSNPSDPNTKRYPYHIWSNDPALNHIIQNQIGSDEYPLDVQAAEVSRVFEPLSDEVFAYQEMNKASGKVQNDKNIYNSVTTLLKAQSYELSRLETRQATKSIYQFNLISIIDSDLIQLYMNDETITASEIDQKAYILRYIINKKESFSRIRFIRASKFEELLVDYSDLHRANCDIFEKYQSDFYENILQDPIRSKILIRSFKKRIQKPMTNVLGYVYQREKADESLFLSWNNDDNRVDIELFRSSEEILKLNSDNELNQNIKSALQDIYRYSGKFYFTDGLPF